MEIKPIEDFCNSMLEGGEGGEAHGAEFIIGYNAGMRDVLRLIAAGHRADELVQTLKDIL